MNSRIVTFFLVSKIRLSGIVSIPLTIVYFSVMWWHAHHRLDYYLERCGVQDNQKLFEDMNELQLLPLTGHFSQGKYVRDPHMPKVFSKM